jgi:hypothetical protein
MIARVKAHLRQDTFAFGLMAGCVILDLWELRRLRKAAKVRQGKIWEQA